MPELPEVETMVRDLQARIPGHVIVGAEISWDRIVGHPDSASMLRGVVDRRIESVERRGKFALLQLDGNKILGIHRGMTGSVLLRKSGSPEDRFVRARFMLDDGTEMRLDDSRKFGRLFLVGSQANGYKPPWDRLGVEPLSKLFTINALAHGLAGRRAAIKTVLLNQRVIAGIGNIYADESLFAARILPTRPAMSLSRGEVAKLRRAIVATLNSAIEERGTTFSTYRDVDGTSGDNQQKLMVFHRHGQRCPRCGKPIERIVLGARGTHFCPRCQR